MNPEMQILVNRIEALEGQTRGWKLLVTVAILLAAVAIAIPAFGISMPWVRGAVAPAPTGGAARYSTVEANAFLLRDYEGRISGGLQAGRDSSIRLVLGSLSGTGAAFLEVRRDGSANLTLRGQGGMRMPAAVLLLASSDNSGKVSITDSQGMLRFRAP